MAIKLIVSQTDTILHPIIILFIGIAIILILLTRLDLPPFLALILATFSVGVLSPEIPIADVGSQTAEAFGDILAAIGIPILMAAIIGKALIDSGAAERIVRSFQSVVGRGKEDVSLAGSSLLLSIPVFFDTVFYLLAPLARSMRARTGGKLALYIAAIIAGAFAAHALVPPTPGPLAVSEEFGLDIGLTIGMGLLVGIPSAVVGGVIYGRWVDSRIHIPLRDTLGTTAENIEETAEKPVDELPRITESLLPILSAIILITADSVVDVVVSDRSTVVDVLSFLGDPNIALTIAAILSILTLFRFQADSLEQMGDDLLTAIKDGGNIIAITAAGGAFGVTLGATGVGDFLVNTMDGIGVGPLLTAWLIAAVLIVSTGSLTVAMITSATMMADFTAELSAHPVYMLLAIGTGAMFLAWHNSSPFWIINEIGGLNHDETIRVFSIVGLIMSVVGIIFTLILATVMPMS